MLSAKDVAVLYETLLSSPGMNEPVKLILNLPRKQILVLSKIIEAGLNARSEGDKGGWLALTDEGMLKDISGITSDLLQKAGLAELNDRISSLIPKS